MTYFIIENDDVRQNAVKHITDKDGKFVVRIEDYSKKRSLAQNRLMWMWYKPISDYTGNTTEQLHALMKHRVLGYETYDLANQEIKELKSTTKLNAEQMSEFLSAIEVLACELGVILPYPQDYRFIMEG